MTGTDFQQNGSSNIVNAGFLDYVGSAQHAGMGMTNRGTIRVTGSGSLGVSSGGAFTNDTTGILDFQTDAGVAGVGGNTGFVNRGAIEKTAGTGITVIGSGTNNRISFQNFGGSYTIQSGTLSLQNDGDDFPYTAGAINVAAGATFDIGLGNARIYTSGTFTSTGPGRVTFSGGRWDGPNTSLGQDATMPGILNFAPNIFFVTGGVFNDAVGVINTGTLNYSGANQLSSLDNRGTILVDAGPLTFGGNFINDTTGILNFTTDSVVMDIGNSGINNAGLLIKSGAPAPHCLTASFPSQTPEPSRQPAGRWLCRFSSSTLAMALCRERCSRGPLSRWMPARHWQRHSHERSTPSTAPSS